MRLFRILFAILLALGLRVGTARADTYTYDVNGNGHITVVPVDANTSGYATLAAAKAANHSVNGVWAAGDTVNLTPGKTFPSGGLGLDVGKSGATWFTFNGNGATISYAVASGTTAVLNVQTSGVRVLNLKIANTSVNPGSNGRAYIIGVADTIIAEHESTDVEIVQHATQAQGGTASIQLIPGVLGSVSGTFTRCKANFPGGGMVDIFGYGPGTTTSCQTGVVKLVDCEFSGATYAVSANSITCDGNVELYIYGGVFHDDGGIVIAAGPTQQSWGRIYVNGATVYNSGVLLDTNTNTTPQGVNAGIHAQVVENCLIFNCGTGIILEPGDTGFDVATTYPDHLGYPVARNNVIIRDPVRFSSLTPTASNQTNYFESYGIMVNTVPGGTVYATQALIENCTIKGFGKSPTSPAFKGDHGIIINGCKNFTTTIRNCIIEDCYIGLEASSVGSGLLDIGSCLFKTGPAVANSGNGTIPRGLSLVGFDTTQKLAVRMNNTIVDFQPSGSGGYAVTASGTKEEHDPLFTGNHIVAGGGATGVQSGFTFTAAEANTSGLPTYDANGRIVPGSNGYSSGRDDPYAYTTADAGTNNTATATTLTTTQVSTGLGGTDRQYVNWTFQWSTGARAINLFKKVKVTAYSASNGTFTVNPAFNAAPLSGDPFTLAPPFDNRNIASGAVVNGTLSVSQFHSGIVDNGYGYYVNQVALCDAGTNRGQWRRIVAYQGEDVVASGTVLSLLISDVEFSTDVAGDGNDYYAGMSLRFDDTTATTELRGWSTSVVTNDDVTGIFTVANRLPVAPTDGDSFVLRRGLFTVMPRWNTPPNVGDHMVILPPIYPSGGDISTLKGNSFVLSPYPGGYAPTDMYGRARQLTRTRYLLGSTDALGWVMPGPLSEIPPLNDFRRSKPNTGLVPGRKMRVDDVAPTRR